MRLRYVDDLTEVLRRQLAFALRTRELIGYGLRRKLAEGYTGADFRADLRAGAAVAAVSLPLSLALAVAAGVAPQHGLYTAIVAGVVVALLGGTRVQITPARPRPSSSSSCPSCIATGWPACSPPG